METQKEYDGYFIYNEHDNKALFKVMIKHFGD
jgi:hypothetical protein